MGNLLFTAPSVEGRPSISCRCGRVRVYFLGPVEKRTCVECCCVDCLQKTAWAAKRGGPPLPEAVAKRQTPLLLSHVPGKVVVTGADDGLLFAKLRRDAATTFAVTKCCSTILFGDHVFFQNNAVSIFPQLTPLLDAKRPTLRCFVKDWPAADYAKLLPAGGIPAFFVDEDGDFGGVGDYRRALADLAAAICTPTSPPYWPAFLDPGSTFKDLLKANGKGIVDLNLPLGPTSFNKQLKGERANR